MANSDVQSGKTEYSATEIYEKHGVFIRKAICCHVKDQYHADDIFQDFFLHLVANPLPKNIVYIESYLYRAVVNCIAASKRQTARYRDSLHRHAARELYAVAEYHPASSVINADEAKKASHIIEMLLPLNQAAAVTKRYRDECDIQEIAEMTGLNKKRARQYVSRGLNKIHCLLTANRSDMI